MKNLVLGEIKHHYQILKIKGKMNQLYLENHYLTIQKLIEFSKVESKPIFIYLKTKRMNFIGCVMANRSSDFQKEFAKKFTKAYLESEVGKEMKENFLGLKKWFIELPYPAMYNACKLIFLHKLESEYNINDLLELLSNFYLKYLERRENCVEKLLNL